jgi:hypothetical protein
MGLGGRGGWIPRDLERTDPCRGVGESEGEGECGLKGNTDRLYIYSNLLNLVDAVETNAWEFRFSTYS